jgi:hypothetical protein
MKMIADEMEEINLIKEMIINKLLIKNRTIKLK